jgi:hypothetical protein
MVEKGFESMRIAVLAAAACALAPAPLLAQDRPSDAGRLAEELSDPATQEQLATMAEAMAGVMLDMPVAPLLRAAAQVAGEDPDYVNPDARVADLVGPEAAEAPREFARELPRMMGVMAGLAVAMEDMLPRLAEIGERVRTAPYENE